MKFVNPIKYIQKKISNHRLEKQKQKREDLLKILKGNQCSVNQKWWHLINNKKVLTQSEYDKWYYFLTNYEFINRVK